MELPKTLMELTKTLMEITKTLMELLKTLIARDFKQILIMTLVTNILIHTFMTDY